MFTVVRSEIFISIPVYRKDFDVNLCVEDEEASINFLFDNEQEFSKSLTLQEVCDLIDALEEVKSRMRVG